MKLLLLFLSLLGLNLVNALAPVYNHIHGHSHEPVHSIAKIPSVSESTNTTDANLTTRSAPVNGPGFKSGIAYGQYTAAGQCRTASAVNTDIQALIGKGHDLVRIYGVDCNGPQNVWAAVKGKNMAMFLGIYNWQNAVAEANSIADQLGNNWSQVNTISVGNEVVNGGAGTADQVIAAMNSARATLRSRGYNGPVVTTDTMVATYNYPQLCTASDYCAFNCHAFFDGTFTAAQAGQFVTMFKNMIAPKVNGKTIVISESGWPSGGQTHGSAVPGKNEQAQAVAALKAAFPTNLILFEGFNEYWKVDNAYSYGAEHYWGIYGDAPGGK